MLEVDSSNEGIHRKIKSPGFHIDSNTVDWKSQER